MKISTKLKLAIFVPALMATLIVAALAFSYSEMGKIQKNGDIVRQIRSSITELNHFVFSYILFHEERPQQQFLAEHDALTRLIASVQLRNPDQQGLLDSIREDNESMADLFLRLVSDYESAGTARTEELSGTEDRLLGLLLLKSYEADSDAALLRSLVDDGIRVAVIRTTGLILLVVILATLPLTIVLARTERSIVSSLSVLRRGAAVIGSGNLDARIDEGKNDEIGDLSRAFNRMTANLKNVTASKSILEQEVAERKQAEEALQRYANQLELANKELESFSYTVSHDLRAPLRSMDGFSRALLEDYSGRLDEQGREWLANIRASSQQMGHLIDDILGLSRVIRTELKFEKVDLSELARSIAAKLKETETERQAEFVIMPGVEVTGDNNLLNLVLQNLLGNAFKFTSGCPHARIEFGVSRQESGRVYFVRDNGAGFDMKYVDKLFKPFQRLHSSEDYPGTGIGLATVQRIIQRHGGKVWVDAELNKGATFYFNLDQETN